MMLKISRGDIVSVGGHLFGCGDIEAGDLDGFVEWLVDNDCSPEMVYTDPPWSDGNCKYWRTMAKAPPSIEAAPHKELIRNIFNAIQAFGSDVVFMEQSFHEDLSWVVMEAESAGYVRLGQWTVSYGSKGTPRPNELILFAIPKMSGIERGFDPSGLHNNEMTELAFEHFAVRGETVFDPCVGLGTTARMAHKYDMRCVGFELDPNRLARTIALMAKLTGASLKYEGIIKATEQS